MTSAFQELIKTTSLTRMERTIADYVLNNFRDVCFMTSHGCNTISSFLSDIELY